jgi:DNA-directed RNA polymerase sigma subunit (sigma70/sigma32)
MVRQGNYRNPSPEQIARYDKALAMRRDGKLLREIGEELGVTTERARQIILNALRSCRIRLTNPTN